MNQQETTILFLITGLVTACGSHQAAPILQKARMEVINKQYLEAIFTAGQIIKHYPDTLYAQSAKELIALLKRNNCV